MKLFVNTFLLLFVLFCNSANSQHTWGRLANAGFEDHYIKSTYFFAGNWRNGVQFYDFNPSNNTGLFTLHPSDSRHLGWSENVAFRDFAIDAMITAGVNMVNMSYWGPRGTDNWAFWAPMQTSSYAHDQLFTAALDKHILVAPYIESYSATDNYTDFSFKASFPGIATQPAPKLDTIILDLVDRYLIHPQNTRWPEVWAQAYDQDGNARYIISVIHVSSDQFGVSDQTFAEGFDRLADTVFNKTGIRIGFMLDALPVATYSPGNYKLTPETAETWLATQKSILGIQCFISEIWTGYNNDAALVAWKRNYCQRWSSTTVPYIIDISPGYDAHIVFPSSMIYGNNQAWRDSLSAIVEDIEADGITVNTWNGYTEGFASVPTLEYGSSAYTWIASLYDRFTSEEPPNDIKTVKSNTNQLTIYPNPVKNELFIYSSEIKIENANYSLFNLQGQLIRQNPLNAYNNICMQDLPKGVYMVKIKLDNYFSQTIIVLKE